MGILKSREEHLPVTCAVLKEEDRKHFFELIQAQRHGKPDQIARSLGLPQNVVSDWIEGKMNIPYHLLQRLSHEYGVEMPPIGELRREIQPVAAMASATPAAVIPKSRPKVDKLPSNVTIEKEEKQERGGGRRDRKDRGGKQHAQGRKQRKGGGGHKQQPHSGHGQDHRQQPRQAPQRDKDGLPVLSEALAYWVGASLARAKSTENGIVFTADAGMGQDFADIWARRARELFGREAKIEDQEGAARVATLEAAGIEEFLKRLGFVQGHASPAVPRWVWSNPAWKTACLRGVLDAAAAFTDSPTIVAAGLPESLGRSVQKIAGAVGIKAIEAGTTVTIESKETIEIYYDKVGSDNLKLREQLASYFGRASAAVQTPPAPQPKTRDAGRQQKERNPQWQQHGKGRRNRRGGGKQPHQRPGQPNQRRRIPDDPDEPLDFEEAMRLVAEMGPEHAIEPPGAPVIDKETGLTAEEAADAAALRAAQASHQPSWDSAKPKRADEGEEPEPGNSQPKSAQPAEPKSGARKPTKRRTVYRGRPGA